MTAARLGHSHAPVPAKTVPSAERDTETMADTTVETPTTIETPNPNETPARPRRRDPIAIKWHHSMFEISLVSVQALTAAVTMVVALVGAVYVHGEHEDRRQARMTRAWTLLNDTSDARGHNVGQIEALQSLHADGANLREIDMAERYLQGVVLTGANLYAASFKRTRMTNANLRRTDLRWADFERAKLKDALLDGANLEGADLGGVDLAGASLRRANLTGVNFNGVHLSGTDLSGAKGLTQDMLARGCADPERPPILAPEFEPPPAC